MLDVDMALVIDVGSCSRRNNMINFGGPPGENNRGNCAFNAEPQAAVNRFAVNDDAFAEVCAHKDAHKHKHTHMQNKHIYTRK
jgi:hypothetical protein